MGGNNTKRKVNRVPLPLGYGVEARQEVVGDTSGGAEGGHVDGVEV